MIGKDGAVQYFDSQPGISDSRGSISMGINGSGRSLKKAFSALQIALTHKSSASKSRFGSENFYKRECCLQLFIQTKG